MHAGSHGDGVPTVGKMLNLYDIEVGLIRRDRGARAPHCQARTGRQGIGSSRALISPQGMATLLSCRCSTIAPHSSFLTPTNGRAHLYRVGSAVIAEFKLHLPTINPCVGRIGAQSYRNAENAALAANNGRVALAWLRHWRLSIAAGRTPRRSTRLWERQHRAPQLHPNAFVAPRSH